MILRRLIALTLLGLTTTQAEATSCIQIGGTSSTFSRAGAIRGNVLHVTGTVAVTEITMQLTVPAQTPIHVAIYRNSGSWIRYPNREGFDIVIEEPREGALAYQTTGRLEPPLILEGGYDYLVGFGWGDVSVSFARDSAVYPDATPSELTFGQVLGLFGVNESFGVDGQLPDQLSPSTFTLGAHSMQLCTASTIPTVGEVGLLSLSLALLCTGWWVILAKSRSN